jgi:lactoylglutathione lyase
MKLSAPDYIVLIVEDLDRSLEFYLRVLGLTLGHRTESYAQLWTGPTQLSLYERSAMQEMLGVELAAPSSGAPSFELGFKVEDVDDALAELAERGVETVAGPTNRAWGQRSGHIRDPDGHLIEIVQDRAPG